MIDKYWRSPNRSVLKISDISDTTCGFKFGKGSYLGTASLSAAGIQCQSWSSQYPNPHPYTEDSFFWPQNVLTVRNYCRNPDNAKVPWCYSSLEKKEKLACDVDTRICGRGILAKY